jgi:hypothetical protein
MESFFVPRETRSSATRALVLVPTELPQPLARSAGFVLFEDDFFGDG